MYFLHGLGGSGKTFLCKTLIHYFITKKKNLSMAWTGIASTLLLKGMTSHRRFRLPLDLNNIETAFLKLDSDKKTAANCFSRMLSQRELINYIK